MKTSKSNVLVLVISVLGLIAAVVLLNFDYEWAFGLLILFGIGTVMSCIFWAKGSKNLGK